MKKTLPLLAAGLSLFLFSNGRFVVPVAAWLAPIFLIRFFRRNRPGLALATGAALFPAAAGVMLYGIIPPALGALFYGLTAYYGILWFLPYAADRLIAPRVRGFAATLVFPAAAVVAEYANALALGDWGSAAFSQPGLLPLQQVLSLAGIGGLTFLISWFGAVVNWIREGASEWQRLRLGAAAFSAVLAAVLFFGGARLTLFPPGPPTVRVAGFTELQDGDPDDVFWEKMFARTRACAAAGARIVLWPEAAVDVSPVAKGALIARARDEARAARLYLLAAFYVKGPEPPADRGLNAAVFIDPGGRVLWEYVKAHPVPGSTDRPGDGRIPIVDTPYGRIGAAVCYDLDFPALIRQAGRRGVDIMLDPSWDWRAIDPLHTEMAAARAVENGFSLVRQAPEGLSIAVDYQGRTLAAMDHFRTEDKTLIADVPIHGVRTLYGLSGDWLAWLCAAGLPALALSGRRRPAPAISSGRSSPPKDRSA
ncbi:MAG TPA: nitrilase-related carbon-nitrogen hydrolase [Acidobacteriota bacterium]|nr:nitrilase-related carbon-nitrogen hydrolase [Acidobacteriota bacterium]